MSELGLIFLLFMIGLELDVQELVHLGLGDLVLGFCWEGFWGCKSKNPPPLLVPKTSLG